MNLKFIRLGKKKEKKTSEKLRMRSSLHRMNREDAEVQTFLTKKKKRKINDVFTTNMNRGKMKT